MPQIFSRKIKSQAVQRAIKERQRSDNGKWSCCGADYDALETIGRHINAVHEDEISALQQKLWQQAQEQQQQQAPKQANTQKTDDYSSLTRRRAPKGGSDPIEIRCACDPEESRVILFYKYVSVTDPPAFANEHLEICQRLDLTGKVRIAAEGMNVTLAGEKDKIEEYMDWVSTTAPLRDNKLSKSDDHDMERLEAKRYTFFKPSKGCRHVFADLSVKLVPEICPLGRPSTVALRQLEDGGHKQGKLPPEAFHEMLQNKEKDTIVLDTRNYYESRIGAFKDAIRPAIRKFSRFPDYVDRNRHVFEGKTVLTYCTGGIRCEKATAYMRQVLSPDTKIYMLDGGIHNYLEWSKNQEDQPLWIGKNYVFDARQALCPDGASSSTLGTCQACGRPWDVYQKCSTQNCHLLVLYCPACAGDKVYCCTDCEKRILKDGVCYCERQRRLKEMEPIAIHHQETTTENQ